MSTLTLKPGLRAHDPFRRDSGHLELGAGSGHMTRHLYEQAWSVELEARRWAPHLSDWVGGWVSYLAPWSFGLDSGDSAQAGDGARSRGAEAGVDAEGNEADEAQKAGQCSTHEEGPKGVA